MTEFRIIAHGDGFDVDDYLSVAKIAPTRVWRKNKRSHFEEIASTSGFEIILGDGDVLEIEKQERIAIDFLKTHFDDLRKCGTSPGMQFFLLFLHERVAIRDNLCGFYVGVFPGLLQLATDLKIRTQTYVELVREDGFF